MAFSVVVKIEVRNEDGDVVDYKGYPAITKDGGKLNGRIPLATEQTYREFAHIENAHATLNNLHGVVTSLVKLGEGQ